MIARVALLAACAAASACAGDLSASPTECRAEIVVTPSMPIAGAEVRLSANAINEAGGIPTFQWTLRHNQLAVPFQEASADGSEITFTPATAGVYSATMTMEVPGATCVGDDRAINVAEPSADDLRIRLHVTPPELVPPVPPIDREFVVPGGANFDLTEIGIDPGRAASGEVRASSTAIAAYLRFLPDGQPGAVVEAYASAAGGFTARVQLGPHKVLVVPMDPALPPRRISDPSVEAGDIYTVDAGTAVSGVVRRPNGTGLPGAKVQIVVDGVPSTIATTGSDGAFTLRASLLAGDETRLVVTAPAASGLPRIDAIDSFDFAQPVTVAYASTLLLRNASGTIVQRSGALANAQVSIVGTIPDAATVTTGTAATVLGTVRIAATADGTGALPSTLVPAAELFAVVAPAGLPGDHAVAPFDTRSGVPATILAPAMIAFSTSASRGNLAVPGARLELEPAGPLALAGAGAVVLYADAQGTFTGELVTGALYTARFSDPSGTAGSIAFPNTNAATLGASVPLPPALILSGAIRIQAGNLVPNAAIEVFCSGAATCTGLERTRAMGEGATDSQGRFAIAVTDPNPM